MKSRALLAMAACVTVMCAAQQSAQYEVAKPGYRYEFPRDHFNHEGFQTEWWYYTGNLKASDGHRFGFELTFFRQGVDRAAPDPSVWSVRDLYFAHLALSDLSRGDFYHTERFNRAGPGLAGASLEQMRVWNGNWQVRWEGSRQFLQALNEQFALEFALQPEKPAVVHGKNGVSQKAAGAGHASHYISFSRLQTTGKIELEGKEYAVEGSSWMDHEFFTDALGGDEAGWDWLSVQLDDHSDVMLYRLRHKDGSVDPYSSGTYIDASGKATHLELADFRMEPLGEVWTSPATGATYPIAWNVEIPKLGLAFAVRTSLKDQEITGKRNDSPSYWEGAMEIRGQRNGNPAHGVGYLELTGYDRPLSPGGKMR